MFDLNGRVAVVTGGGQGVGAAVARALGSQGAAVAVNDLLPDRTDALVRELTQAGVRAAPAVADVTDLGSVEAMLEAVETALGPVDILVNNAGIPSTGMNIKPFLDTTPQEWAPFIGLNLVGVLNCARAALPGMVTRGWGRMVTVVSEAARVGERNQAVYAASKAAAAGFSRSIAKEVARSGVTVNCIALGAIHDDARPWDPERVTRALRFYPVGRLGNARDAAAAVAWLVSAEAEWVTGQTIGVSGGYVTS
jgi:3-oxoacyl-[acyl-carrier protein] reductase